MAAAAVPRKPVQEAPKSPQQLAEIEALRREIRELKAQLETRKKSSKLDYLFTPIKRGFVRDGYAARLSRLSPAGLIIVLGVQEALAESGGKPVKIDLPEMAQWAQESVRRVSDAAKELRKKGVLPWVRRGKSYAYSFDYNKLTELPERGLRKAPGAGVKKVAARLPANLPCPEQIPICPYIVEGGGDGSFLVTLSPPVGGVRPDAPLFSPSQNQQVTSQHRKSMSGVGSSREDANTGSPCPVLVEGKGDKHRKSMSGDSAAPSAGKGEQPLFSPPPQNQRVTSQHRKSMSGVRPPDFACAPEENWDGPAAAQSEQKAKAQPNAANSAAKHSKTDPWLALKKKVCGRIPQLAYDNWFAPTRFLENGDGAIRVAVPHEPTRECLEREYADLVHGVLAEVGFAGVRVTYEVQTIDQLPGSTPPPAPQPGLREQLEALVPLSAVGEALPDHLWQRIEQRLGATPWPVLRDVITAKLGKIRSWAFVADHLAVDARQAWERSGGRKEDGQKEPNAYLDKNGKPVEWPDEWLTEFRD